MARTKTTTRSYTLALLSTTDASDWLPLWSRVFQTHHAVCRGAREYGEFYLNLRGGLAAPLADCADEQGADRRRLLQRGARRMLALGWLSVESVRGAEHNPHRVRERVCEACNDLSQPSCERDHPDKVGELKPGQSLPKDLAQRLLREILSTHKGVCEEAVIAEWSDDCVLALTARIRPDAVIVNRASAFAEWQKSVGDLGAEMSEQARRILFAMCGDGFASLTLPEEETVKKEAEQAETDSLEIDDSEDEDGKKSKAETEEAVEPSNASRRVYCDLFGGDPGPKIKREGEKIRFAATLYEFLSPFGTGKQACVFLDRNNLALGEAPRRCDPARPLSGQLREWRKLHGWDRKDADLLPREASPDNKKNKIAVPYRKLLVAAGLWPESNDEGGAITPQHEKAGNRVQKKLKEVSITTGESPGILGLVNGILNACAKRVTAEDLRVFKPGWAKGIQDSFERAARVGIIKGAPEFRYLMFALAARRISQTQTWTKRNEAERHKAAVKEDAAKKALDELDPQGTARAWFTAYEEKRGEDAQAASEFHITRRMIGECDAVFKAWHGIDSIDEREKETASVQAKAEKFGDAKFYADLSDDPCAAFIWRHEQGAEILKQWVKLRQARFDQQRFKIPRFCHPDPFHHPTWCEFGGSSKPKVWYAWKPDSKPQSPEPGGDADGSRRLWMLLPDFAVRQAKAVPMRWRSKRLSQDLGGVRGHTEVPVPRADRLGLAAAKLPLLDANNKPIRYRPEHPFTKDAKGWNARLQLDRDTLERLEKHWDDDRREWRDDGKALRQARWFVTFAPALAASDGPGRSIHPKLGWKPSPHSELNKKQKREGHAQLILSRLPKLRVLSVDLGHRYAAACVVWETPDAATFDIRKVIADAKSKGWKVDGSADGLFVHIHEPTSKIVKSGRNRGKPVVETKIYRRVGEDYLRDSKTGKPTNTPHPARWARLDRQFLIKLQGEEKPAREASEDEYKLVQWLEESLGRLRTEDDALPWRVDELMSEAVRSMRLALRRHGDAARIAYVFMPGSKRHVPGGGTSEHTPESRRAAILDALMRWHDLLGDDARSLWRDPKAAAAWVKYIRPNLAADLPMLAEDADRFERKRHRATLEKALEPVVNTLTEPGDAGNPTLYNEWKRIWEEADGESAVVPKVETGQKGPETKVIAQATGWHNRIRRLADWIMPRGLHARRNETQPETYVRKARLGSARNVGGLSLTRIATIRELWQIQKAYRYKAKPDDLRAGVKLMEDDSARGYKFGDRVLQTMERMREQRVKQIASRIAASALGLGGHWKDVERRDHKGKPLLGKDGKPRTKRVWVEEPSPKYPACHAVVIENLRNYRPDELQTRRENKALMSWSSGKVRKYLEEGCQLHGLHLREVMPNYTSRQCSRTGTPGWRCQDIPVAEFVKPHRRVRQAVRNLAKSAGNEAKWTEQLSAAFAVVDAKLKDAKAPGESEDCLVVELFRRWDDQAKTWTGADGMKWKLDQDRGKIKWKFAAGQSPRSGKTYHAPAAVRVLNRSGDLFVAATSWSNERGSGNKAANVLQADLNAAANIGLRALLDPDFIGKWWYVPCDSATGKPARDKCAGAACLNLDSALPRMAPRETVEQNGKKTKTEPKSGEITNAWRDVSPADPSDGEWMPHAEYWAKVKYRVVQRLRAVNGI